MDERHGDKMSIKGIDAQHMVTRAAEFVKDASVQQRKNELLQDYLTVQSKVVDAQEKQKVPKTLETEKMRMHPDQDGGGGYGGTAQKDAKSNKDEEQTPAGHAVPAEQHIIDIKV